MPKPQFVAISLCVAALLAPVGVASAAGKKISHEEAWKRCTAEINKSGVPKDLPGQRQAAGGACMKKTATNSDRSTACL